MNEQDIVTACDQWLNLYSAYNKLKFADQEDKDLAVSGIALARLRYKRLMSAYVQKQIEMDNAHRRLESDIAELVNNGETK
jgi:molecular chaperone GrpE (heat shock protein)